MGTREITGLLCAQIDLPLYAGGLFLPYAALPLAPSSASPSLTLGSRSKILQTFIFSLEDQTPIPILDPTEAIVPSLNAF